MSGTIKVLQYQGHDALILPAMLDSLSIITTWLGEISHELNIPTKIKHQLLIVADEIVANIVSYAYASEYADRNIDESVEEGSVHSAHADMALRVTLEKVAREEVTHILTLTFSDKGRPFNPLDAKEPDITAPLDERPLGGLGVFLVKQLMDSVEYSYQDNQNVLVVRKGIALS